LRVARRSRAPLRCTLAPACQRPAVCTLRRALQKCLRQKNEMNQSNFNVNAARPVVRCRYVRRCRSHAQMALSVMALATQVAFASPEDWRTDAPGRTHRINPNDLPAPFASPSNVNAMQVVSRPEDATLAVPPGFTVAAFATGLEGPRRVQIAPNGDIFIAESL